MVRSDLTSGLLKRVSRSFYLSMAVLPSTVRVPVSLAYLFARAADTIADSRLTERRARVGHLAALRAEMTANEPGRLAGIIEGAAGVQSGSAESDLIRRLPDCFVAYHALGPDDRERVRTVIDTIIEGMMFDLQVFPGEDESKLAAVESLEDLDHYTYLVAGCVGEFWTDVHVAHRPRLRLWDLTAMSALGIRFGKALQLTNVLRDVPRDLRRGRCYLPSQSLSHLGLSPTDLLDPRVGPAVQPLLRELLGVTLEHYDAALQYTLAIPAAETGARLACTWPLLIGLRTVDLLARTANWLDPAVTVKVSRARVYGLMTHSLTSVWSTRALANQARRLRDRIQL